MKHLSEEHPKWVREVNPVKRVDFSAFPGIMFLLSGFPVMSDPNVDAPRPSRLSGMEVTSSQSVQSRNEFRGW